MKRNFSETLKKLLADQNQEPNKKSESSKKLLSEFNVPKELELAFLRRPMS
jgi:hypothetical protein